MAAIAHLTPRDYTRQPWKNGGGTTTELCRDEGADRWLWRLSVADVERSGPFSDFGGYRRFIVLLEGRGMALSFDGGAPVVIDRPYRPFAFDGGARTECALLDGPIRDLNLIVDEARASASLAVRVHGANERRELKTNASMLLHVIAGGFEVRIDERTVVLAEGETLCIGNGTAWTMSATALGVGSVLAQATIEPRR